MGMSTKAKKNVLTKSYLLKLGIPLIFIPGIILSSVFSKDLKGAFKSIEKMGYKQSTLIFPKEAKIVRVLDGDTVEIDNGLRVRFLGVNSSERGESDASKSAEYLRTLIDGKTVNLEYEKGYEDDKYGRILAYIFDKCTIGKYCINGRQLINAVMIKEGYAQFVQYKDRRPLRYEGLMKE